MHRARIGQSSGRSSTLVPDVHTHFSCCLPPPVAGATDAAQRHPQDCRPETSLLGSEAATPPKLPQEESREWLATYLVTRHFQQHGHSLPVFNGSLSVPPPHKALQQVSCAVHHVYKNHTHKVSSPQAELHGLKILLWAPKSLSMRFPIDHMPLTAHLRRLRRVNDFFPSQF